MRAIYTKDIPITLICGYLGSGKTTLINQILSAPQSSKRLAILINDFGDLNVDADLIKQEGSSGSIISLKNGCVCCKIQDDLASTLETIKSEQPDGVLIEASGVAMPNKLKKQCLIPGYDLGRCAVTIDAKNFDTKRKDKYVGYLVQQQAIEGDLLVITKTDLAPDFELPLIQEKAQDQNKQPTDQVLSTDPNLVGKLFQAPNKILPFRELDKGVGFASNTLSQTKLIPQSTLENLIKEMPPWVERVKGTAETEQGLTLIQASSQFCNFTAKTKPGQIGLVIIYPEKFCSEIQSAFTKWTEWFSVN